MNWLDYVLLAILLFSVVMSWRKGFSREIVGLAAAFLALVLGMWFYGLAGSFLTPYVSSPRVANFIGFLLVVFAVVVVGALFGWIVSRFMRAVGLSFSTACLAPPSACFADCSSQSRCSPPTWPSAPRSIPPPCRRRW